MLQKIVGSRHTAVGTAEDDDLLLGFYVGVMRHRRIGINIARDYYSSTTKVGETG